MAEALGVFGIVQQITGSKVVFFVDERHASMIGRHPDQALIILNDLTYQV